MGVQRSEPIKIVAALTALGYRSHTEKDRGDRIFLWLGEGEVSRYHVNVTSVGSGTWCSLLRLRDLLRNDARAHGRYAAEKRSLADQHRTARMSYLEAKSRLIAKLLGSADSA